MTDKYEPRVGDLLVYGSSVYRLVAVKDKKCADVRCEYVITAGGLVQKKTMETSYPIFVYRVLNGKSI